MCAILGVSFAPGSTINRRALGSALLTYGESRGHDASGYAYVSPDGDGYYKKDVPGSRLNMRALPQDATAMILHTRAATQGDPRDNDNNHPVLSPSGDIRLVHNGVIYNDDDIRKAMGKKGKSLADVDSAVIPAVIEEWGLESTNQLAGYASAAWFEKETGDTIHLARFKTSTVAFATLYDGSFVFASEPRILANALYKLGIGWFGNYPDPFSTMGEKDYFQIIGGEIVTESKVAWKNDYTYFGRNWDAQTTGGRSAYGTSSSKGSEDNNLVPMALDDEDFTDGPNGETLKSAVVSALFASGGNPEELLTEEEYDNWVNHGSIYPVDQLDPDYVSEAYRPADEAGNTRPLFYTLSHDGDFSTYASNSGLLSALSWHSGLTTGENHLVGPDEGNLRWVNHIADIGTLTANDEKEESWVKNDGEFAAFQNFFPGWVGEGIGKLRQLVGA